MATLNQYFSPPPPPPPPPSPHSSYTSIADNTNGRRREDENSLLQQSQLPEHKDVWPKVLEVLSDGSSWMDHLSGERERERTVEQTD